MNQLLESLYWIKIAADGGLARVAFRFRKQMPAFFVYRLTAILRSAILLPLHLASSEVNYSHFYWRSRPIESVMLLWFSGELVGLPNSGFVLGFMACVCQIGLLLFPGLSFAEVNRYYLAIDQAVTILAGLAAIYAWFGSKRLLATGLLIATVFPLIWQTGQVGGWLRYIPTMSVLAAQVIWIVALYGRGLDPHSKPLNHTLKASYYDS